MLVKYILESKGDKITKMIINQTTDVSSLNLSDADLLALIDKYKVSYDFEGMEYQATVKEGKIEEHIVVDTEIANMDKLLSSGIVQRLSNKGAIKYLSLKETLKSLESIGAVISQSVHIYINLLQ